MASITTSAKSMVAYTQSDAIMWKLDPRAKLLWVCVTIALCVMFRSPISVAAVCLQTFVISQMWGFPVFTQIKQHKGVFIFLVVFVGLLNLLFTGYVGGETLVSLNLGLFHITLTDKGLLYTITVTIRLVAIFITILLLTATTKMAHLTRSLELLGLPYRFCFLFSLTWRLIPVIAEGLEVTIDAQRTRGFEMDSGSLVQKIKGFGRIIKPTFLLLGNSVNDMTLAFISKGVNLGAKNRTSIWQPKLGRRDYGLMIYSVLLLAAGIACACLGVFKL